MSRALRDDLRGIRPSLAKAYRAAKRRIERRYPGVSLRVVSGYRSQARQDQLRAQWDRGDRTGLVYRPARVSRHSSGRALDLGWVVNGRALRVADVPFETWAYLARLMEPSGVVWGGWWQPPDLPHFEIP
jgi:uncharacterized protein YcbK (DUF882 family)